MPFYLYSQVLKYICQFICTVWFFANTFLCIALIYHIEIIKVKVYIYSTDIPSRFSRFYINYPQVLELTLSQSHLPGENASQFSSAVALYTVPMLIVKACLKILRMNSASGIEPRTSRSWVQLNHSVLRSTLSCANNRVHNLIQRNLLNWKQTLGNLVFGNIRSIM